MSRMKWFRWPVWLALLWAAGLPGAAAPVGAAVFNVKIDPGLRQQLSAYGRADFFVWLADQADLSPAVLMPSKAEKGQFVYESLRQAAAVSQADLLTELAAQGIRFHAFYIANKVLVREGSQALALALAARNDVARLTLNQAYQLDLGRYAAGQPRQPAEVEPNLSFIRADQAWALGYTGQGVVLSANDTGMQWDHPALMAQYRGWDGSTAEHNYNWWDATGASPYAPFDGHGHGTSVSGVMVGNDGGSNQIGVAPGARVIHCKMITDGGYSDEAMITECLEWNLAPWDLNGALPRPDLAPDAIANSWGFWGGGDPRFMDEINALLAAGIIFQGVTGGEGPACATIRSPGDYEQALTVGSVDGTGGALPGILSPFSARGPSPFNPQAFFPDVMAPGVNIRSSTPGGSYSTWSGTSFAGPHAAGLVGLMWSANPALRGLVSDTVAIMTDTAVPLSGQSGSNCGGDYVNGPNNDWGYGTLDALAAVQSARMYGDTGGIEGVVSDAVTGSTLENAQVSASLAPDYTWITTTNSLGGYHLTVLSGTYSISAALPGYLPAAVTGLVIVSGSVTTQNFTLTPILPVTGTISDANTGWPLAAQVLVSGGAITNTWSDPATGLYRFDLPGGQAYTLTAQAAAGYATASAATGVLTGALQLDLALSAGWLRVDPTRLNALATLGLSTTLPLTLTNLGGQALTAAVSEQTAWLSVSPPMVTLPVSGSQALPARFDTQALTQTGVYTASLRIDTDTPYGPVFLPVTLTVAAAPVYAVDLSPGSSWEGWPGSVITVSLWLTNTGSLTDSFTLSLTLSDPGWPPARLSFTQTTLAASQRAALFITVTLPGEMDGQEQTLTLTARSSHAPQRVDTAVITFTSRWRRLYLPLIQR